MAGTLYVVATPIGNLGDITFRAAEVLKAADAVFCEDTRQTAKLMAHLGVTRPLFAFHQHSGDETIADVAQSLQAGMTVALVSDAGTPGINDPGGRLVAGVIRLAPEARIVPVPGPNAAVALLSVCGFPADRYAYLGFVPHKKGRKTFFASLADYEDAVVFYESKHRILKTLTEAPQERYMVVGRELTKQFETIYRGTARSILVALGAEPKGEFVVALAPKNWK